MHRVYRAAAIGGLVAGLGGCGLVDSEGSDQLNFDAAVVAADGAVEDLQMMHGPGLGLAGGVFPEIIGNHPDCPMTLDIFLCDPIEREGTTYTRSIRYLDAAGNAQSGYDAATTAAIEYVISVEGERSRVGWDASIRRERDLRVDGLLDGTGSVTWNGTGTGEIVWSRHVDDGSTRTYTMTSTSAITDVVIPFPRADDSWPTSGSITRTLDITRQTGRTRCPSNAPSSSPSTAPARSRSTSTGRCSRWI